MTDGCRRGRGVILFTIANKYPPNIKRWCIDINSMTRDGAVVSGIPNLSGATICFKVLWCCLRAHTQASIISSTVSRQHVIAFSGDRTQSSDWQSLHNVLLVSGVNFCHFVQRSRCRHATIPCGSFHTKSSEVPGRPPHIWLKFGVMVPTGVLEGYVKYETSTFKNNKVLTIRKRYVMSIFGPFNKSVFWADNFEHR